MRFDADTILLGDNAGNNITVAQVLSLIDSFLTFVTATFDVSTEPFSTAIKVVKCVERVLHNQPAENPTPKDLELCIDALEKASVACWPEAKQEFAQKALFCKFILHLFTESPNEKRLTDNLEHDTSDD
jgi:hypothetical protein